MIIREIGASLRALFSRLSSKTTTIAGTETLYLDDAGSSVKAALSDAIRYGGGNSTRITTIGNANIHQKSDGTMWLEVTGQTAGNARGAGAFDWQATRTNAAQVASGSNAVAIGDICAASGASSIALGSSCSASGSRSISIGRGASATATDSYAFGFYPTASASVSMALGAWTVAANTGQWVWGLGGQSGQTGIAQANIQATYTTTSDASATVLNITNSAASRIVIPAMRACAITGVVTAMSDATDGYKVKAWDIKCVITRDNSNNTRIVGTPIITELGADTEAASWAITSITADNTNESLSINVTGEAATNIRWQASLFYSQVGF